MNMMSSFQEVTDMPYSLLLVTLCAQFVDKMSTLAEGNNNLTMMVALHMNKWCTYSPIFCSSPPLPLYSVRHPFHIDAYL